MLQGYEPLDIIWISVRSVLEVLLPVLCGAWLARKDILNPAAAKTVSKVATHIADCRHEQ
jgi:predicted permease